MCPFIDLYGATYGNFYVNSKGQISFGGDVIDWTPTGFPAAEIPRKVDPQGGLGENIRGVEN